MLWVIMRSGKVIQYNTANNIDVVGDHYELVKKDDNGQKFWIACIPAAVVERVEWVKPCRVMREQPPRKTEKY